MANNNKENKIEKFTKEAIGKTLNQFNKEIGIADLVEVNKNQDRILNGILSQVNDESTEKTEKSNIITLDNSTDGIVELKEIQGDTNVNVSKIEEDMPITHDIGDKEGNVFNLNEITQGAISIGEIQGNTMVNCNKDDKKELVLMKDLSTQGDNTVTITEGVDGGLVDVTLEGNTLVNVSKTKDITALPLEEELTYLYANTQYTVQFISDKAITADITLGGTSLLSQSIIAGLNRISITTPETLVDNKLIIGGVGANISEVVVTDTDREFKYFEGMKSVGECEELVITSNNSDNSQSNTQQLTHEPLRAVGDAKDRYVLIDGNWYIEKKCREYTIPQDTIWTKASHMASGNYTRYWFRMDRIITDQLNATNYKNFAISELLPQGSAWTWPSCNKNEMQIINNSTELYVQVDKTTIEEVASLMNGSKIIYRLASPQYEPIDYNPFEVYSDATHITTNSAIPTNITIKNHGFNCLLKPSTTYTVSSNLGLNTVTTPSVLTEDCLRFMDTDTSDITTTMKDVLVLEGDWTTKADLIPSNFSGIESAFEQELVTDEANEHYGEYKVTAKVVGKNKFDDNQAGVIIGAYRIWKMYDKDTSVAFSIYDKNSDVDITGCYLGYMRGDGTFKAWLVGNGSIYNKTVICDDFAGIQIHPNTQEVKDKLCARFNIQIEEDSIATEYEPYKENNITFYINEPLRGVGDVKDRIYVKDDKVVVQRNCGKLTLDSSQGFKYISRYDNGNLYGFEKSFSNIKPVPYWSEVFKCDKYNYYAYTSDLNLKNHRGEWVGSWSNNINIVNIILRLRTKENTLESLSEYLNENPITIVYQLAEPIYEEVEYSSNRLILNTFNNESFNNSTLFLDTNISPKLSFKPLWEELVYVKSNTKYYIQFNAVGSGEVVINLGGTELTTEIVEGYNCIPITTPSESTNLMTISGQGITISEVIVSEVVCGGYYKGLQSCFEEHMENGKYIILLRGIALDGSKVNGIKLYINEPLRGIKDIKDRLCIKNGKLMVERNIAERIVDDTTPINMSITNDEFTRFTVYHEGVRYPDHKLIKCSGFPTQGDKLNAETILLNTDNIVFAIANARLKSIDVEGFKEWIKEHPQKVQFKVSTTYEEVTNEYGLPIVFEGYENGIVYIDSAVTPTTHIKYTSNNQLATTLSEAEEQNIATQEDINMNVITYMMDIDMMLTDMEMSNDISVMAVRRDSSNENMLDRMSDEDKKVYRDNTVVMLEKMITANVLEKEDIEGRIDMYYNKNRISKEQYKYLKSLL